MQLFRIFLVTYSMILSMDGQFTEEDANKFFIADDRIFKEILKIYEAISTELESTLENQDLINYPILTKNTQCLIGSLKLYLHDELEDREGPTSKNTGVGNIEYKFLKNIIVSYEIALSLKKEQHLIESILAIVKKRSLTQDENRNIKIYLDKACEFIRGIMRNYKNQIMRVKNLAFTNRYDQKNPTDIEFRQIAAQHTMYYEKLQDEDIAITNKYYHQISDTINNLEEIVKKL